MHQTDEERKREQDENVRVFEAAMDVARIQSLPGKVANAFGQPAPIVDALGGLANEANASSTASRNA